MSPHALNRVRPRTARPSAPARTNSLPRHRASIGPIGRIGRIPPHAPASLENPSISLPKIRKKPSKTRPRQPSSTLKTFLGHRQAGISVQAFSAQAHMHCLDPHASFLCFFAPFVSSCEAAPVNSFVNFLIAGIPNFTILPLARPPVGQRMKEALQWSHGKGAGGGKMVPAPAEPRPPVTKRQN
jgi:hypothetical protein